MKLDKLYDSDIVKPDMRDSRCRSLFAFLEPQGTQIVGYAWFLDSGNWNDCDNVPMKNIPILLKNKSEMVFRGYFDGKNYFMVWSPIKRTKAV